MERGLIEQVLFTAYKRHQGSNQLFPYGIQRRIRDLREQLFEVVEKQLVLVR